MKRKKLRVSGFLRKKKNVLSYQNLFHLSKLTKKQKNWKEFQKKIYSTELGRPIRQYRLFRVLKQSFPLKKTQYWKEKYKKTWNSRRSFHNKKALCLITKPFWFLNKAVPIPGVAFLQKAKIDFQKKLSAYKIMKTWLGTMNKKQKIGLFNIQKKQNFSKNWNTIVLMESLYESIPRKAAFCYNAPERNSMFQSRNRIVNGSLRGKQKFLSKPADLFLYTDSILLNRLYKNRDSFFRKRKMK